MQPPPFRELQDLTASERKLTLSERADPPPSGEEEDQLILTDLSIVTEMLQVVACPHCKQHRLSMHAGRVMGYAVEMALSCDSCGKELDRRFSSRKMATDPNITRQPFRVNRRAVLAAKEGGFCQTGLTRVTAIMNIRGGLHHKTFAAIANSIQRQLYGVAADTLAESRRTVHRVHAEMYGPCVGPRHLDVSYDGTWKKRGFQSPFGVGFMIDTLTGLVIDYAVLSKYCFLCEQVGKQLAGEELEMWKQLHVDQCAINHTGSSGSMETEAAKLMWARSVELMDAKYTSLLGDGDAAVLSALNVLQPYGADVAIVKQECINHISKRMYRGLAAALKAPAVGGSLGGKCKLTQVRMKKMSTYYRNAIVKHAPDVAAIRKAIWAIYYHSVSTIDEPRHEHCDVDWCWWMQAMAAGVDPEQYWQETRHDRPLPLPAAERLMPVFERLSHPELLERCSLLGTSNANESLHSVVWRRAPKTVFTTRSTVEIAVALGVVQFNCGGRVLVDAANSVVPGSSTDHLAATTLKMDHRRLRHAVVSAQETSKTSRKRLALLKLHAEEVLVAEEGNLYSPGGH